MLYNFDEICYDNGDFEEEKEVAFFGRKRRTKIQNSHCR